MPNGKNPLMLMMALSVPGAAHAIGLGDIHVDSALNENFAAEIDLVGATALELADLRASLANRETFLRFGADRPAFLSSATFKVVQDSHGHPVLAVRSSQAFTEPVVNFLVDLNWRNGTLVRQYTVLLDPANYSHSMKSAAAAESPAAAPAQAQAQIPPSTRKTTHVKVGAKATLRGIAWRVGERSPSDLQRMMIAIFRANPAAFDGNINRLHRGALLTIPAHAELAAISKAEARKEFHAQMAAWRSSATAANKGTRPEASAPSTADAVPEATAPSTADAAAPQTTAGEATAQVPTSAVLDQRVKSMEEELNELKALLHSTDAQLLSLREQAGRAGEAPPVHEAAAADMKPIAADVQAGSGAAQSKPKSDFASLSVTAGLGVLASALAALYMRMRRRPQRPQAPSPLMAAGADEPVADSPMTQGPIADGAMTDGAMTDGAVKAAGPGMAGAADTVLDAAAARAPETRAPEAEVRPIEHRATDYAPVHASCDAEPDVQSILEPGAEDSTQPLLPIISTGEPAGRNSIADAARSRAASQEPTVSMHVDTVSLKRDPIRLDYHLLDLDMTAQHVHMPSVLNEQVVVKERRTNLADVLRLAIEREPDRHDLRLKLLELYYSVASTNCQAFLDVVQKFARERHHLPPDQWERIATMGRQIAAGNPLFIDEALAETAEDDLADCA